MNINWRRKMTIACFDKIWYNMFKFYMNFFAAERKPRRNGSGSREYEIQGYIF